ncbi:MAG TPA: alpha/beta hydrolase [Stellaceae bacterium]|jgi:pimeloyl-ACP methyl ester carboxylesterase|nr:alpha/beta hydrolase [Stellaceae bacterium]
MPIAKIRGVNINYEIVGKSGPWVALVPGGRRDLSGVRLLAQDIADKGYRVMLHDRRNCGLSDVVIDGDASEYEIWADDLYELLRQHDALPAFIGGSSSGCRTSILFALRHPEVCRGLLLWRITGGRFACERLAINYYQQYMDAAQKGGMAAVCALEHFKERCEAKPSNRDYLMSLDPKRFIDVMGRWKKSFDESVNLPIIGASEAQLRSLKVPTVVIPGNDRTHGTATGKLAASLIPHAELRQIWEKDEDADLTPAEDWDPKNDEMTGYFVAMMKRAA